MIHLISATSKPKDRVRLSKWTSVLNSEKLSSIYVGWNREGQKKILIGSNGARIKKIGEQARADMESLFDSKVMLRTWVKVRTGWSDDERALRSLGYMDE